MVRSLEAYRQGSNNTLPIEVTLEELVQGMELTLTTVKNFQG